ncbi:GspH/FimT family pseudopilin [Novosphingobium tardum]|uniref:Type II secretion system protein H n=1 Tax=Novosphingobium tardum TaxID=1538021 RepID=A0ABV8RRW6_9SPHN
MSTAMPSPASQPEAGLGESGFSLVELMVVLFVMGLLATVAVLSIPGDSRVLRDEAERFAARTVAARDEAISGGRPVALVVSGAGYYFERRGVQSWEPLDPQRFGIVDWKAGTRAALGGGTDAAQRQRVVFDPVGLSSTEARVMLSRGSGKLAVNIARDGTVALDGAR